MKINLRVNAIKELSKITFNVDEGFRILADFVGTCSIATEIELSIEKMREEDSVIVENGVRFFVPKVSVESLPDEIFLDYNPKTGFKVSSKEEIFGYSFQLKEDKR